MSWGEQLEEKTKCMERVRKKQKEPLGDSMWAIYAVLEKEHSPPSLACLVLHTQLAMSKHKCPALCSEEMPLDLTSSQIFSACPKILGKYSFFLDEYKTKCMQNGKEFELSGCPTGKGMKKMYFSRLALELGLEVQPTMSAVPPKRKYFYASALYDHDLVKHS